MAIYKQVQERMLQPFHYFAANGKEAKHDTPESELSKDGSGNLNVAYGELEKRNDRLIYTSSADTSLMTDAELEKAFYAFDGATVSRMEDHGAVVKVERSAAPSSDSDAVSAPEEPLHASDAAKKEADKQGIDLRNVEGSGKDGQITVNDVKLAAANLAADDDDAGVRTYEAD